MLIQMNENVKELSGTNTNEIFENDKNKCSSLFSSPNTISKIIFSFAREQMITRNFHFKFLITHRKSEKFLEISTYILGGKPRTFGQSTTLNEEGSKALSIVSSIKLGSISRIILRSSSIPTLTLICVIS